MVHCSDVGNRLYEFLFRKSTYKSRDWQKYTKEIQICYCRQEYL